LLALIGCLLVGGAVYAEDSITPPAMTYQVSPNFSASQVEDTSNFYDMLLHADQTETFGLTIQNLSEKEQTFKIGVNTATTNRNGIVDYTQEKVTAAPKMHVSIKNLIKADTYKLTIHGKGSQTVHFKLEMPSEPFAGILLGGITVQSLTSSVDAKGIKNTFMQTIAVRLRENQQTVAAKLTADKATIGQENKHNYVTMWLENPQPKLMTQLQGEFSITKKGTTHPIIHEKKKNLSFAPNSRFQLPLELKTQFEPGQYVYTIHLKNQEGQWTFAKEFVIKNAQAKKYNANSVDQRSNKKRNWWIYLLIIGLIVLLCSLSYFWGKKKVNNKQE